MTAEKKKYAQAIEQYSVIQIGPIIDIISDYSLSYPSIIYYAYDRAAADRQWLMTRKYYATFSKRIMQRIKFLITKQNHREFVEYLVQKQHFISIRDVCDIVETHKNVSNSMEMGYKVMALLFFVHDAYNGKGLEKEEWKVLHFLDRNRCGRASWCTMFGIGAGQFGDSVFLQHPIYTASGEDLYCDSRTMLNCMRQRFYY